MASPSVTSADIRVFKKTVDVIKEVARDRDVSELLAAIRYLQERDGDVTSETLQNSLSNSLPARESLRLTRHLRQHQYTGPDALSRRTRSLHHIETAIRLQTLEEDQNDPQLIATVPDDDALDAEGFDNLLTEILELIQSAESHLWLISPYLSEQAFERMDPALRTAVNRGAIISLVTRYLTYGGEDYESNRDFARCLTDQTFLASNVELYEYIDEETWETFHAKVVIADQKRAYLGTANVTGTGFLTNLELGVLLSGTDVSALVTLCDSLRNSTYLHHVERVGDGFVRSSS